MEPGSTRPSSEASVVGWITATVGMARVSVSFRQGLILRTALEKCERAEDDQDNGRDESRPKSRLLCGWGGVSSSVAINAAPFRADKILPQNGRQAVA
jgi:hypothetical protein